MFDGDGDAAGSDGGNLGDGGFSCSSKPETMNPAVDEPPAKKKQPRERKNGKRVLTATPEKSKPSELESANAKASPPVKQTKKRSKKEVPAKEVAPQEGVPKEASPSEEAAPVQVPLKQPSDRMYRRAMNTLIEAKRDPASWFHVVRLWKAIDGKIRKDNPAMKKFDHWGFSMYWLTCRVGLLHKKGKVSSHVLSFGGGFCNDIGMPLEAAYMYVVTSVCFSSECSPTLFGIL